MLKSLIQEIKKLEKVSFAGSSTYIEMDLKLRDRIIKQLFEFNKILGASLKFLEAYEAPQNCKICLPGCSCTEHDEQFWDRLRDLRKVMNEYEGQNRKNAHNKKS